MNRALLAACLVAVPIWLGLLSMGCATLGETPDTVHPFALNPSYTERIADPGKVDLVCYNDGKGKRDNGTRKAWDDSYCGCLDEINKTVWLSRHPICTAKRDETRAHENCHINTGISREARAECDRKFS